MRTADFDYELPAELIAQQASPRGASRMLLLHRASGFVEHREVGDLPELLDPDDLLLLNDTRVIPARLYAVRPSGRRFELLVLRALDGERWNALLRPSARARVGERLRLADHGAVIPEQRLGGGVWVVRFEPPLGFERLDELGEAPLPPYIERPAGASIHDRERYQTVYAANPGAVAAPTAGLHFTTELLGRIKARGVEVRCLTLHVGIGTFRPVAVDDPAEHRMDFERYEIGEETCAALNHALQRGRRIVCIGTTTVRTLEGSLAVGNGLVQPGPASTDLFITPGFTFLGVGAMLTNFHLPRSTLLMLVSAFAGRERILAAYREAIREGYRFYSYGDAMLIL